MEIGPGNRNLCRLQCGKHSGRASPMRLSRLYFEGPLAGATSFVRRRLNALER